MSSEQRKELEACLKRASKILYDNTDPKSLETLEGIETSVRSQVLEYVSPQIALFLLNEKQRQQREENGK